MRSDAYVATPPAGTQPDFHYPPYVSSVARSPRRPLIPLLRTASERTGPIFGPGIVTPADCDLTAQHQGEPLGERIIVHGRILDQDGVPVRGALVEVWQANAAGRYRHNVDRHHAPLDSNFTGCGRLLTDNNGYYCFRTIKPGPYPWQNHHNAWRPAHIHFSLFGSGILSRLVTQMYFPGDPLQSLDPILNAIPDERGRRRLISRLDMDRTEPGVALAFYWDVILRGPEETPFEEARR